MQPVELSSFQHPYQNGRGSVASEKVSRARRKTARSGPSSWSSWFGQLPGWAAVCGIPTADQERKKNVPNGRVGGGSRIRTHGTLARTTVFETPRSGPSAWVSICVASWSSSPLQTATPNSLSSSLFQTGSRIREADRRDPPGAMHDEIRFEGFGPTVDGSCVRCARVWRLLVSHFSLNSRRCSTPATDRRHLAPASAVASDKPW